MTQNILIADDHALVRDTIADYLGRIGGFTVSSASDLDGAARVLRRTPDVDLAILDYEMPGMNGLEGLREMRKLFPDIKLALMSGVVSNSTAARALSCGASGYLPKSMPVQDLVQGIHRLLSGEQVVPFDVPEDGAAPPQDLPWGLSPREYEVLELVSYGRANRDIAATLNLKEVTVKLHVTNILSKMGAENRTQAAVMAKDRRLF